MCGIAGVAGTPRIEAERLTAEMLPLLRHRGPDDSGTETMGSEHRGAALCATRLAVRDLSPRGHQPMRGPTGCIVAFNGELYNADELRARLTAGGRTFSGSSDTEVVLAAFEEYGDAAWPLLKGMFAIAAWDARSQALSIVRDPLGIKPLYYEVVDSRLAFASELRTLIAALVQGPRLEPLGLMGLLATGAVEEPLTIVERVRMLPPGSFGRLHDGRFELSTYWSIDDAFSTDVQWSRDEAVARLREELFAAVRRQMVSDVPLGVFLSGGIDSSSLVALAASVGQAPRTVSVVFSEPGFSEAEYIEMVRRRYATDHHEVELSAADFLDALPSAIAAMDQPSFDGVNTFVVSRLARESGLTVALSGLGGDELFAGYELFRTIPRLERLRERVPALPARAGDFVGRRYGRADRGRKLGRWLSGVPGSAYEMHRELFDAEDRRLLLPGLVDDAERGLPTQDANVISRLEMTRYMRNVLLRDADVMSMANSLEVRVPLLDQDLVELVASIPGEFKVAPDGREKPLLADAVRDLVPEQILRRDKMGFTLPFEEWLRGPLRDEVRGVLMDPDAGGAIGQELDGRAVTSVWERFERGETSWSRPWALYVAKIWGARYLS